MQSIHFQQWHYGIRQHFDSDALGREQSLYPTAFHSVVVVVSNRRRRNTKKKEEEEEEEKEDN